MITDNTNLEIAKAVKLKETTASAVKSASQMAQIAARDATSQRSPYTSAEPMLQSVAKYGGPEVKRHRYCCQNNLSNTVPLSSN